MEGPTSVHSWKLPFSRLSESPAYLIADKLISSLHLAFSSSGNCLYTGPLMAINKIGRGVHRLRVETVICALITVKSIYLPDQHVWWNIL